MQYSSERRERSSVCGREETVRNVRAGRREGRAGTHLKLFELLLLLLELVEALLDVVEQVLDLVALRVCAA